MHRMPSQSVSLRRTAAASWGLRPRRLDRFAVPRAFGPPARHPPGLRPRPTASPFNGPPKGAINDPQQGRGLPPPLSGASRLPGRLPRKGLRPSPPLRGGSPPQQPANQKENRKFRACTSIALLSVGVQVFSIWPYDNYRAGGEKGGFQHMCIGCRASASFFVVAAASPLSMYTPIGVYMPTR